MCLCPSIQIAEKIPLMPGQGAAECQPMSWVVGRAIITVEVGRPRWLVRAQTATTPVCRSCEVWVCISVWEVLAVRICDDGPS